MRKYLLLGIIAYLIHLLFPATGLCQRTTLSHFIEASFETSLVVIEGDRYIDANAQEVRAILHNDWNPQEKIAAIVALSDYSMQEFDGAYLLLKRYSDAQELPCISKEELLFFSETVAHAIAPLLTSKKKPEHTFDIYDILSALPESQWQLIQRDILPVRELSPENKTLLANVFTETFYGSLNESSSRVGTFCKNINECRLALGKNDSGQYFTYQIYAKGRPGPTWPIYLNAGIPDKIGGEKLSDLNMSFGGATIQDAVKRLNARGGSDTAYSVAGPLANKPLSIAGIERAEPQRVMQCIAKLYDLRLAERRDKIRQVVELLPKRLAFQPNSDIFTNLAANLPYPLRRTLKKHSNEPDAKRTISRLIPRAEAAKSRVVSISAVGELYKVALVLIVFEDVAKEFREPTPLPDYLTRFDSLYLSCKRAPGLPLTFTVHHEEGGKMIEGPVYTTFPDIKRD